MFLQVINAITFAVNVCLFVYLGCQLRQANRFVDEAMELNRRARGTLAQAQTHKERNQW